MWDEAIPISALQHFAYCPRQCALIHVEAAWEDNLYTLRGRRAHEGVDLPEGLVREGVRVEFALPLYSERLGLVGRADAVEFHGGVPYPVEHKVGPRRTRRADEIQLCAQALCLEEMLGVEVPKGALFYRTSRKRREVVFTPELRALVAEVTEQVRTLLHSGHLPPPVKDARCRDCSLVEVCLPHLMDTLEETL
ncbi:MULTISPECIES: CRISPR-associated protein Cas4 [Thermus]|jgi:CRISPR-associated exonuclease Cas4|uniref:CRISPR-associated exonuclease Cas4 n=1 Tax=Thermus brockianus TaxID=56956 RepID=A0A1J0LVF8_THEBO|nr:CRISPR-associated protein Cas4 [Thermus brockianus]APD10409.1 PD-(D/E)XK nuclease superfamily protein [Thermus brockianus]